jgi:hypothetical protein
MVTTRLDMRLDEEIKAKAEKASVLLGLKSLTEYIVRLIDDNATQVIAQHESITVENDAFDPVPATCLIRFTTIFDASLIAASRLAQSAFPVPAKSYAVP